MVAETEDPESRLVPTRTPLVYKKSRYTLKSKKDVQSTKLYFIFIVSSLNLASWPPFVNSANEGSYFDSVTWGGRTSHNCTEGNPPKPEWLTCCNWGSRLLAGNRKHTGNWGKLALFKASHYFLQGNDSRVTTKTVWVPMVLPDNCQMWPSCPGSDPCPCREGSFGSYPLHISYLPWVGVVPMHQAFRVADSGTEFSM